MIRSLSAEWLKLRHSRIGWILAALPAISLFIGGANYYFNQSVLQNGWYSLWTQVSLFYGEFFLPVLIAICCAYLCRLEHVNRNWNAVLTAPVSVASVFIAKLAVVSMLILVVQLLFFALYIVAGIGFGLSSPLPDEAMGWILRGWIASISISSVQLGLSVRIRSFAAPIGICLCAVFVGLGLYVAKLGMFFPYSLLTVGMGVMSQDGLSGADNSLFYMMNILFIVILSSLTIRRLRTADVIQA